MNPGISEVKHPWNCNLQGDGDADGKQILDAMLGAAAALGFFGVSWGTIVVWQCFPVLE